MRELDSSGLRRGRAGAGLDASLRAGPPAPVPQSLTVGSLKGADPVPNFVYDGAERRAGKPDCSGLVNNLAGG